MCLSVCFTTKKQSSLAGVAAAVARMRLCRKIYVTYKMMQSSFLIETGSDDSYFPKSFSLKSISKVDFT